MSYEISTDKRIEPAELVELMVSVGWGETSDYDNTRVESSISAYSIVTHCRNPNGSLIGYVSAFTDGAFSTFVGELVVRPEYQCHGIGSALLALVINKCNGVPVYARPFQGTEAFFLARGFRVPKRPMAVVSMRNAA